MELVVVQYCTRYHIIIINRHNTRVLTNSISILITKRLHQITKKESLIRRSELSEPSSHDGSRIPV
jgi:hypothetical protein